MAIKMPSHQDMERAVQQQREQQARDAVDKLSSEIHAGDTDPNTWYALAVAHMTLTEYAPARDALLKAVAGDPQFLHAWTNLAVTHYELGEYQEAAAVAKRALNVRAGFLPARMNLAMASLKLGRFAEAEAQFRAVLQAEPEMPTALAGMYKALQALNRPDEALGYKLRAVQAGVCFVEGE